MKVTIEKIVPTGKSLAKIDGKVLLTDRGLPGELVEVEITKRHKNFDEALTSEIITKSPDRVAPKCSHYELCGQYQYISYPEQARIKEEQIVELFTRSLSLRPEIISFKTSGRTYGYRNKISLKIKPGGETPYAYNEKGFHNRFAPVKRCFLASDNINGCLDSLATSLNKTERKHITAITVRENSAGDLMVLFEGNGPAGSALKEISETFFSRYPSGVIFYKDGKSVPAPFQEKDHLTEKIMDREFLIGPESFFQVNTEGLKILAEDIRETLSPSSEGVLADLYCGVGTFGIIFSEIFRETVFVDKFRGNTGFLRKNISVNSVKNARVISAPAERNPGELIKDASTVLVDPPRRGLDRNVTEALSLSRAEQIIYVSCDPATLVRDLKLLNTKYNVEKVIGYDMFPQTPHIEIFCRLIKR